MNTYPATDTEALFYAIGKAENASFLHLLRGLIDTVTSDADERDELNRQINLRFATLNAEAVGRQEARWN
jgi:hypothetical protein